MQLLEEAWRQFPKISDFIAQLQKRVHNCKDKVQYEQPYCIGYTMSSRKREPVHPIQYGREYRIYEIKSTLSFALRRELA